MICYRKGTPRGFVFFKLDIFLLVLSALYYVDSETMALVQRPVLLGYFNYFLKNGPLGLIFPLVNLKTIVQHAKLCNIPRMCLIYCFKEGAILFRINYSQKSQKLQPTIVLNNVHCKSVCSKTFFRNSSIVQMKIASYLVTK